MIGFLNCILRSLESIGIPLSISFIPESLNYSIWNRMYMMCFQVGDCNNHSLFFRFIRRKKQGNFWWCTDHYSKYELPLDTGVKFFSDIIGKMNIVSVFLLDTFWAIQSLIMFCLIWYYSQTGRTPSALWGAALYISALSHGLNCSKSDIVSHAWNFCWCATIKLMIDKILRPCLFPGK